MTTYAIRDKDGQMISGNLEGFGKRASAEAKLKRLTRGGNVAGWRVVEVKDRANLTD